MLKPFTKSLAAMATVLLVSACASTGSKDGAVSRSATEKGAMNSSGSTETAQSGAGVAGYNTQPLLVKVPEVTAANAKAFEQAVVALQTDDIAEAELLLRRITTDQPELAGPWINLGQVYLAMELPEEARIAFQRAVQANPSNCAAHSELGVLSRRFGDFESAETHYLACLSAMPGYKDAYLNLGILYELYLGKLPEALNYYRQYQSLLSEPDRRVQGWVMDLERRLGV